jgi:hypothetical protein
LPEGYRGQIHGESDIGLGTEVCMARGSEQALQDKAWWLSSWDRPATHGSVHCVLPHDELVRVRDGVQLIRSCYMPGPVVLWKTRGGMFF